MQHRRKAGTTIERILYNVNVLKFSDACIEIELPPGNSKEKLQVYYLEYMEK